MPWEESMGKLVQAMMMDNEGKIGFIVNGT